jgi:hypothetical protein
MIDQLAPSAIDADYRDRRFLISATTRAASEAGKPCMVESGTLSELVSAAPKRVGLLAMLDRLLLLIADRSPSFWIGPGYNVDEDYPLIGATGGDEFSHFIGVAEDFKFFDFARGSLTTAGWLKVDELRSTGASTRQAFVAMWFDASMNPAWEGGFKPGIEAGGQFDATRIDQIAHNGKIDDRIISEIRRSALLVADFTGHRGGVYFEAGYAMGLGIPVIWTCHKDDISSAHFDTRQYNHITWSTPDDLREALRLRIAATIVPPNLDRGRGGV